MWTICASVREAALRADTSRVASLKSPPGKDRRKGLAWAVLYLLLRTAGPAAGCKARRGQWLRAVCAKDVGESRFHRTCFSLKGAPLHGRQSPPTPPRGGAVEALAGCPTAEPAVAQAELQTGSCCPVVTLPSVAVLVSNNTSAFS